MNDPRLWLREWLVSGTLPAPELPDEAEALLPAIEQQGLAGLLLDDAVGARHAVPLHVLAPWPPAVTDQLREITRSCLIRGVRQLDLAARAQGLLLQHGLRSLPLKGAAVAETLYTSPAHRPMSDVDLLAIDDPDACLRVLLDHGFALASAAEHAWALVDPATGSALELHRSVTSCPSLFPIDTEAFWQRREVRHGQIPCAPSPPDLLLLLSLHASFQHGLVLTLTQWMDFRRLIERYPASVASAQSLASGVVATRSLAAALLAAEIAASSPLTTEQRTWAEGTLPRGLRAHVADCRTQPLRLVAPESAALARMRWRLAAGQRRRLIWATLFPGQRDAARGPLARATAVARRAWRLATAWRR